MRPEITSWREAGPLSAPVVVLLHSIATQGAVWAPQVAVWSSSFRLIVPDLPGHGSSEPRASIRTLDAYADALAQLLDEVGAARPIVVGLSLGGMIAQMFALRHPGLGRAYVLANTSARTSFEMRERWSQRAAQASSLGMESQVSATLERWFTPEFAARAPLTLRWIADMIRATPCAGYIAAIEAICGLDTLDRLGNIDAPVLVVGGQRDTATPLETTALLAQRLPQSELLLLEDAAHLTGVEQPVAFTERVGAFLRSVPP